MRLFTMLTVRQSDLLSKVHNFRCLYRVWVTRRFFYQTDSSPDVLVLPELVSGELRGIARSAMSCMERDILKALDVFLKPARLEAKNRFPVWVSMMQLILTYHDLFSVMELQELSRQRPSSFVFYCRKTKAKSQTLLRAIGLMCEAHFKNEMPERGGRSEATMWTDHFGLEIESIFVHWTAFGTLRRLLFLCFG